MFRSGTTEVMGKLAAEFAGGQPKADVLLIADAVSMEALKEDGRLLAYPEAKVDGFRAGRVRRRQDLFRLQADHDRHRLQHRSARQADSPGPTSPSRSTRARSRCRARSIRARPRSCWAR